MKTLRLHLLGSQVKEGGAVAMSEEYPSNLTDKQWQVLRAPLPKLAKRARRPLCRRLIINAILYIDRPGCQWRALPHDFPKWKTVHAFLTMAS